MSRFSRWPNDGPTPGSAEWHRIQAGVDRVMNHITRSPNIPQSASMIPPAPRGEAPRAPGPGSVDLKPPPGIEHADRIAESFAQQDRIEALIKQRALVRELAGDVKEPEIPPDPKAAKK